MVEWKDAWKGGVAGAWCFDTQTVQWHEAWHHGAACIYYDGTMFRYSGSYYGDEDDALDEDLSIQVQEEFQADTGDSVPKDQKEFFVPEYEDGGAADDGGTAADDGGNSDGGSDGDGGATDGGNDGG